MFKKLILGGLPLLLILSMAFSATPAFAGSTAPGATPVPLKLATITSLVTKLTYPPQLVINGALPSACYLPVLSVQVSPVSSNVSLQTISIFVQAQPIPGVICTQAIKSFASSITLDARTLKVTPGKYLVLVNPVNGVSRFQTTVTLR